MKNLFTLFTLVSIAIPLFAQSKDPISAVPEPTTYLMFGAGLTAVMLIHNRFSKKK
jgi:hypothetical protein